MFGPDRVRSQVPLGGAPQYFTILETRPNYIPSTLESVGSIMVGAAIRAINYKRGNVETGMEGNIIYFSMIAEKIAFLTGEIKFPSNEPGRLTSNPIKVKLQL